MEVGFQKSGVSFEGGGVPLSPKPYKMNLGYLGVY